MRERRREGGALAGDEPEGREEGNAEGGTGDRGEFCLKRWARMEETAAGQTRAVGGGQAAAWAVRDPSSSRVANTCVLSPLPTQLDARRSRALSAGAGRLISCPFIAPGLALAPRSLVAPIHTHSLSHSLRAVASGASSS